jgi:hypothetical protein
MAKRFTEFDLLNKGLHRLPDGTYGKHIPKATAPKRISHKTLLEEVNHNNELGYKVNLKPLSINDAYKGRRFVTDEYKEYKIEVEKKLPKLTIPPPPYEIYFKFGFSSEASDWDNCIKTTQDCIAKFYNFNDKKIRRGVVETEIVPKGKEYFIFDIKHFKAT